MPRRVKDPVARRELAALGARLAQLEEWAVRCAVNKTKAAKPKPKPKPKKAKPKPKPEDTPSY